MKFIWPLLIMLAISVPQLALAEEHEAKKEAPAAEAGEESGEAKEGKGKPKEEASNYINMQPMILPVIGPNGPEQLVTIIISLEVEKPEDSDTVKKLIPRLNDAYLQTLYGALDTRSVNRGSLIDITRVKQRLQAPTERVLGKGIVKDILVQAVAQRRL